MIQKQERLPSHRPIHGHLPIDQPENGTSIVRRLRGGGEGTVNHGNRSLVRPERGSDVWHVLSETTNQ